MLGAVSSSPRFTFVRHGQCVANAQGRVVGQLDSPLTTLGYTQAEGAAVLLAGRRDLTAVITSDLQRAHATARIIAGVLDLPLFVEPGLREQHFGSMQGELFGDLTASSPGREHINEVRWAAASRSPTSTPACSTPSCASRPPTPGRWCWSPTAT